MSTNKPITPYYSFHISMEKEVDETITKVENGTTITETKKVTRKVSVPFCIKKPSRVEKEEADIERAIWETKFITKGILPAALLLKTYANYGGILSNEQRNAYTKMQADYLLVDTELKRLQINDRDNKEAIDAAAFKLTDLLQSIKEFEREQAVFFENTAEAKARQKLAEWYILHLSYYRPVNQDESLSEWTPFFKGETTEDKLNVFDEMFENKNEMLIKARPMLEFLSQVIIANDGSVAKEDVEDYLASMQSA